MRDPYEFAGFAATRGWVMIQITVRTAAIVGLTKSPYGARDRVAAGAEADIERDGPGVLSLFR
jgi:hypothetical protein